MELNIFLPRLFCALGCGMVIGFERQLHHKNAGTRTNGLVALGAAIYVLVSETMIQKTGGDLTRSLGQIVTGVGFICAGVIFHHGANVVGLTTATTVWCSAGIGCMSAFGMYTEAFICTLVVLTVNYAFKFIDRYLDNRPPSP